MKRNNIRMTVDYFFNYLKDAITSREYSKFIFTKNVDLILKKFLVQRKKIDCPKKQISFCEINDVIKINNNSTFRKKLKKRFKPT